MLEIPTESRFEIKYICNKVYYKSLINWIRLNKFNFTKEYPFRKVNNAYFDNHFYDNYKSNVYGISSRAKFRLRWYDKLESCDTSVFEIKYKRNFYFGKGDSANKIVRVLLKKNTWKTNIQMY